MIFYQFQCNVLFLFMIIRLKNLAKRSLPQRTFYLIPISDGVSIRNLDISFVVSKMLDWRNSALAGIVNFILLNFFKLELCHKWKPFLFLADEVLFQSTNMVVFDLALYCSELVLLQVWWFFVLFYKTRMLCFKSRSVLIGSFGIESVC